MTSGVLNGILDSFYAALQLLNAIILPVHDWITLFEQKLLSAIEKYCLDAYRNCSLEERISADQQEAGLEVWAGVDTDSGSGRHYGAPLF